MVGIEGMVGSGFAGIGGSTTPGMVGMVVGTCGNVGFGRGVLDSGGSVAVGRDGLVGRGVLGSGGNVAVGRDGLVGRGVLGSGGSVAVGRDGLVGRGVLGSGGNVAVGRDGLVGRLGMAGSGGSVALGSGGIVGNGGCEVCSRWRAAQLTWRLESETATIKDTSS